mmetsp:Transcript_43125/g.93651  ORF Transcript_43125/g.93651 Transcript_43125/m.93651 type:complete len:99 (-) Transcript_43125:63-359(-)
MAYRCDDVTMDSAGSCMCSRPSVSPGVPVTTCRALIQRAKVKEEVIHKGALSFLVKVVIAAALCSRALWQPLRRLLVWQFVCCLFAPVTVPRWSTEHM